LEKVAQAQHLRRLEAIPVIQLAVSKHQKRTPTTVRKKASFIHRLKPVLVIKKLTFKNILLPLYYVSQCNLLAVSFTTVISKKLVFQ